MHGVGSELIKNGNLLQGIKNDMSDDTAIALLDCDKTTQNENLAQLADALSLYLQTGIEGRLLHELLASEELIEKKYDDLYLEVEDTLPERIKAGTLSAGEVFAWIAEVSYLSQLKGIFAAYNNERTRRDEQREFEEYYEGSKELSVIVNGLGKENMNFQLIGQRFSINDTMVMQTVNSYHDLFVKRKQKAHEYLVLSSKGRRYYEYITTPPQMERGVCQKIIYHNCVRILNQVEDATKDRWWITAPEKIEFVGVNAAQRRTLKHKCGRVLQTIRERIKDENIYYKRAKFGAEIAASDIMQLKYQCQFKIGVKDGTN